MTPKDDKANTTNAVALTDLVAFRLIHLADLISRGAALVFEKEFGISNAELRALAVLCEEQPLTIGELSRRAKIDKAWVSRSVKELIQRGLIARDNHPTDSRMGLLSLTCEGQNLVAQVTPLAWARQGRLLQGLRLDDVDRLLDVLKTNAQELLAHP
ncbi:MarR family transcriptional regulator [Rhizobium sp. P44RR-XXIV]|uniref:MarR family winged helix-turn-helix transcriptional regulator n=1 Tax=Rhizobium sp. P44RR-XXIV TaxID=1921145 RepID=UPI00145A4861|nr:MarR family transcriptional regulator [Rhizobium sp. P44RR-XXIV]